MPDLTSLNAEINQCQKCGLARLRLKAVPGDGPADAALMFIGEAPGWNENQQGKPFVGAAGHLLDELLAAINLQRADVYITNVIKCRPPDNREPTQEEITACASYLEQQIAIINPRVIVTLGRYSMAKFFGNESISRIHGQPRKIGDRIVFPMYHPAAALRQPGLRPQLIADMQKLPGILAQLDKVADSAAAGTDEPAPQPQQLSLF